MATRIRLKRMGAKHRPFFRLVVADSRFQRDGRNIETLGYYDPLTKPETITVNEVATMKWLQNGAGLSGTARSLLKKAGIMKRFADLKAGAISEQELLETLTVGGDQSQSEARTNEATRQKVATQQVPVVEPEPEAEAPAEAEVKQEAVAADAAQEATEPVTQEASTEASTEEAPAEAASDTPEEEKTES